ncbi:MAG: class I SAM-dependent methyltransferase [Candidatus Shapirobacteria bacterium]
MEKINCPICNNNKFKYLLTSQDNLYHIKSKFKLIQCTNCSLILTNPRPNQKEIKKFYPQNYKPYKTNFKKVQTKIKFKQNFPILYKVINQKDTLDVNINSKKNINVLEIGCGAGNFLYELKLLHPKWNIIGTDISQNNIKIINKNKIKSFCSNLTKLPIKSNTIDVIYGWMVLEHIHNINQALSEIYRVLKKKNLFCFSIPNINSLDFKIFKKNWFALQLPTHLYHFTPSTITKLLNQHHFKIQKIIYQKTLANFFFSTQIIINNSQLPIKIKKIINHLIIWNPIIHILTIPISILLSKLKQSGRITIISQKL